MSSQAVKMETTGNAELDKILTKAFNDIRRRVNNLLLKQEKKAVKQVKQVRKDTGVVRKKHKKSSSSSNSVSE